jgi:hypothetical protein
MKVTLRFDGAEQEPDWTVELANLPRRGQIIEIAPKRIVEVLEVFEDQGDKDVVARVREVVE